VLRRKGREAGLPPSPVDGGDGVGGGDKGERRSAGAQKRRRNGMQGAMHLNNFIFSLAVWIPDLLLTYKSLEQ